MDDLCFDLGVDVATEDMTHLGLRIFVAELHGEPQLSAPVLVEEVVVVNAVVLEEIYIR